MLTRYIKLSIIALIMTLRLLGPDVAYGNPGSSEPIEAPLTDPELILNDFEEKLGKEHKDKTNINKTLKTDGKRKTKAPRHKNSKLSQIKQNGIKLPTKIDDLDSVIQEYQHRIDIIEADLARLQSDINESSITDNKVLLELKTVKSNEFQIRRLTAKLDGNILFDQNDLADFAFPDNQIRIFHGPLMPGRHRVEIHTNVSALTDSKLRSANQKTKSANAQFDLEIPDGRARKYYSFEIIPGTEGDPTPKIKLIESEYK